MLRRKIGYVPTEWKWYGLCTRKTSNAQNMKPSMISVSDMILSGMSFSNYFLLFFPENFMEEVILVQTNTQIVGEKVRLESCCDSLGYVFHGYLIRNPTT